jgi:tetratricopeptide (TPR) repeat protein
MGALDLLDQAIRRDPGYAPALALAGMCHHAIVFSDWTDDPAVHRQDAVRLVRQALQSGADDPVVLTYAGVLFGYLGEDIDATFQLVERALALNPSYAYGWSSLGWLHLYAGNTEIAIQHFETSLRLNPRGRRERALSGIGIAHFFNNRFGQAAEKLVLSLEELPTYIVTYRFLAVCYAHLGRLSEAAEVIERLRAMSSTVVPSTVPYRNPEHRELYLSGLLMAGGEGT